MKNNITAIILTKDEEANIKRCITSLGTLPDRIVVVDSGSKDATVKIARELGAEVYEHPFRHYADQFNWALEHTEIHTTWIYRIDADEVVTEELRNEIIQQCRAHKRDSVNGFLMKHKLYFLGKFLKHGGAYPFIKMTVFKPAYAYFENRAMGEHVILKEGTYIVLEHDCLHYDCKDLTAYIAKHNAYASREVEDYYSRREKKQEPLYRKAEAAKKLRDHLYYRLPQFFRARLYFWYRYYIQLGFLDGKQGKIYAFIQSYFYRYIVDAKIYEREIGKKKHEISSD